MSCCPAINCSNRDVKANRENGLTFHRFPFSNPALLVKWVVNMKRVGPSGELWHPSKALRLCSAHFTPDCFDRTGQTVRLKEDAVPTVFSFPEHQDQNTLGTRTAQTSKKAGSASLELDEPAIPSTSSAGTVADEHSYFSAHSQRQGKRMLEDSTDVQEESRVLQLKLEKAKTQKLQKKQEIFGEENTAEQNSGSDLEASSASRAVEGDHYADDGEEHHGLDALGSHVQPSSSQHVQEKPEHLTKLQQCQQDQWELNFDFHAFQRWRQAGLTCGLTSDTDIASFLLLYFEKTHKNNGQHSDAKCSTCHSSLSCTKCDSEQRRVKTKKKSFRCSVCSTDFLCAASLKVHMFKHTGEKRHICDTCGASFTLSYSLTIHRRSHTGHKPFVCEQCGATFAVRSVLMQHIATHSGEKRYKCQLCPAAFTQSTKLTIHMRNHTGARPYQCEHCGVSFTHSTRLKVHLRCHSGHRPYTCEVCHRSFIQSAHLTVHRRIHTGARPFQCDRCPAAFLDSTHLRRHQRTHHHTTTATAEKAAHVCQTCGASCTSAFHLCMHEWSCGSDRGEKSNDPE